MNTLPHTPSEDSVWTPTLSVHTTAEPRGSTIRPRRGNALHPVPGTQQGLD